VRFLVLVGLFLAGAEMAVLFLSEENRITLIWPPAGFTFAALLIWGLRWWPFIAVAVLILHLLISPVPALFLPYSLVSNVLGPVAGVAMVQRFYPAIEQHLSVRNGLTLLQGGLVSVGVSALIGVAGLVHAGMLPVSEIGPGLAQWALSNLFGLITIAPVTMLAVIGGRAALTGDAALGFARLPEKLAWIVALALMTGAVLWAGRYSGAYAVGLASMPLAMLLWSAQRFEPLFTAAATAVLALFFTALLGLGLAGFPTPTGLLDAVILLIFMCVLAMVPQILSAASFESRIAGYRMLRRAHTDALTGLPNRSAFEDQVRAILARRDEEPLALAYLDLDQFKVVNDIVSHRAGDELLKALAAVLQANLGPQDTLSRISGDEFAVLMRHVSPHQAKHRAEQLREAVANYRFAWQTHVLSPSVSIGLLPFRAGVAEFERILADADAACFVAKERGGNRVEVVTPGQGDVHEQTIAMRWAMRLSAALQNEHFQLHCQRIAPLQSIDDGRRHFEILLRLYDPTSGKLLLPGQFVPAAERFKLGVKLDRYVFDHCLQWFARHPEAAAEVGLCSINLTAASLQDEAFGRYVRQALVHSPLRPDQICFEITETSAVRDVHRASRFIQDVRALGCRFALDDFGTGFCSFGYLNELDVDFFKIDGSFVRPIEESPLALAVVRAIADIARVLDKQTVAESVSSPEILARLRSLGVNYAQGYAVHRPVSLDRFFAPPAAVEPAAGA
jgi:diguanylate cyclase (GGDEF)-like protein